MKKIQKYLNESNKKWNKKDTITILIILLIYGILSFYHLGNVKSPNTFHDFQEKQEVIVELNQEENINNLISFSGFTPANYQVYLSKDGLYYDYIGEVKGKYCFTWEELEMKKNAKYLKIKFLEDSSLGEIGLFNKDQNQIVIKKVIGSRKIKKLYDEQDTVPFEIIQAEVPTLKKPMEVYPFPGPDRRLTPFPFWLVTYTWYSPDGDG